MATPPRNKQPKEPAPSPSSPSNLQPPNLIRGLAKGKGSGAAQASGARRSPLAESPEPQSQPSPQELFRGVSREKVVATSPSAAEGSGRLNDSIAESSIKGDDNPEDGKIDNLLKETRDLQTRLGKLQVEIAQLETDEETAAQTVVTETVVQDQSSGWLALFTSVAFALISLSCIFLTVVFFIIGDSSAYSSPAQVTSVWSRLENGASKFWFEFQRYYGLEGSVGF